MVRSRFAGGDQDYLRESQYRDSSRLATRGSLHEKYGTAALSWFDFVGARLGLVAGCCVLEAGCGPGWLWAQSSVPVPADTELTLTDLSPGMVEEAVARVVGSDRFASVVGEPADLQDLPFAAASFDRVVANHMLYHLPDPGRGVAELARVVRPDGVVIAATNGRRHMREIWEIRAEVFGLSPVDETVDVFGAETGFVMLRDRFEEVAWFQYRDELHCTDPADVIAYLCSTPPGEDADDDEMARIEAAIDRGFAAGGGSMRITKDAGCFVARRPMVT